MSIEDSVYRAGLGTYSGVHVPQEVYWVVCTSMYQCVFDITYFAIRNTWIDIIRNTVESRCTVVTPDIKESALRSLWQ